MKRLRGFLLALLLLAFAAAGLGYGWLRRSLPPADEKRTVAKWAPPGAGSRVTLAYDGLGVPTVSAENEFGAAFGQGYAHARDRRFQMELFRRTASGRLAEVLGPGLRATDRYFRGFGFGPAADSSVARMSPDLRRLFEAYAAGVRAFDASHPAAPEFAALGGPPEPWQARDSELVVLLMFQDLTYEAAPEERTRAVMDAALPAGLVAFLCPVVTPLDVALAGEGTPAVPALPAPAEVDLRKRSASRASSAIGLARVLDPPDRGSNNWAVAPARSATGAALVAGDPHLGLGVPVIWHRQRVATPSWTATGVTLPGYPGVVFGTNGKVAWTGTNVEGDFADLVRCVPADSETLTFGGPDGPETFGLRREVIAVRGAPSETLLVRTTRFGPVLFHAPDGVPLAVQWTALEPSGPGMNPYEFARADSVADLFSRLDGYRGPALNIVAGDTRGHIGFRIAGRVPRRLGFDPARPRDASSRGAGWFGNLGRDSIPWVIDPPTGFLVTANQRTLGREAWPGVAGMPGMPWRAHRIAQVLAARSDWTAAACAQLQNDVDDAFLNVPAAALDQALTPEAVRADTTLAAVLRIVRTWTHRADTTSVAHAYLRQMRVALADALIDPLVAPCAALDSTFDYDWALSDEVVRRLLAERPPHLLDPQYADYDALVRAAAVKAATALRARAPGVPLEEITWGHVNRAAIGHPLARAVPALGRFLDMPHAALAGGSNTVRVAQPRSGASMRMVVDFADAARSTFALPGGQSGHFLSPHYADAFPDWVAGRTVPLEPGATRHTIELTLAP